ncbi:MAG: hypothetical protein ACYS5V_17345, partial [Planctomycetota bacterium]
MSHDSTHEPAKGSSTAASRTNRAAFIAAVMVTMGAACCVMAAGEGQAAAPEEQGKGMAAVARASAAGKHLFIFFFKADDEKTAAMREVFDAAMTKAGDRAVSVAVRIGDPAEEKIVARYGVKTAPMPLVLAVAPNGAITGGFPGRFDQASLLDAFAGPGLAKCLKAIQDGKVVIVCARGASARSNEAAMKAARGFKADKRFAR